LSIKKFFSKICDDLIDLYDWSRKIQTRFETWLREKENNPIIFFILSILFPTQAAAKNIADGLEPLGYTKEPLNKGSKCYIILFSPLLIIIAIRLLELFYLLLFQDHTILFPREFVKNLLFIPPLLIVLLWILPYLFFKLFFPKHKKHISIYGYGAFLAFIIPLILTPQEYHYYHATSIEIPATVKSISKDHRKATMNYIIFSSVEKQKELKKMKFSHLPKYLLQNAKVGDKCVIKGKISKYYFKYDMIQSNK
jgi:hypothetical protein